MPLAIVMLLSPPNFYGMTWFVATPSTNFGLWKARNRAGVTKRCSFQRYPLNAWHSGHFKNIWWVHMWSPRNSRPCRKYREDLWMWSLYLSKTTLTIHFWTEEENSPRNIILIRVALIGITKIAQRTILNFIKTKSIQIRLPLFPLLNYSSNLWEAKVVPIVFWKKAFSVCKIYIL